MRTVRASFFWFSGKEETLGEDFEDGVVASLVGAASRRVGERRRIAKISAAQIDRELAPYRSKERRRRAGSGTLRTKSY